MRTGARNTKARLDGFVILDWGQSPKTIVQLEKWLFEKSRKSERYANHKDVLYYPSVSALEDQGIYIAWWSPAFW